MAVSFDDKILGEKAHYYCDSSDEEEERPPPAGDVEQASEQYKWRPGPNTGVKGVISDFREYKRQEREDREDADKKRDDMNKRYAFTCKTEAEEKSDAEILELGEAEFLAKYREKRLAEMMAAATAPALALTAISQEDFLCLTDDAAVTVILMHQPADEPACEVTENLKRAMALLARSHPKVHWCSFDVNNAPVSASFKSFGLPAILVYQDGEIVGNYVKVADDLPERFCAFDLSQLIGEHL